MSGSRPLVVLCKGGDESLLRDAVRRVVDSAVGEEDRGLVVDEFDGDDYALRSVVDAAQTPPFLTPFRVVICRNLHRFKAEELLALVGYLAEPLDSTTLVLIWASGRQPKALADALKGAGAEQIDASAPAGKNRAQWLDAEFAASDLRLDAGAKRLVADTVGDDLSRITGVAASLLATFGPGARLSAPDIESYLGGQGSVPPWELTDAIDSGDAPTALDKLHRLLNAGDRHPLQLMVTLQSHVERILRLHGSGAGTEQQAAEVLGLKGSTFPARKALTRARALGGPRIGRAIELVAQADVDLRGASSWPGEQVLEVLVVRLARLNAGR